MGKDKELEDCGIDKEMDWYNDQQHTFFFTSLFLCIVEVTVNMLYIYRYM